MRYKILCISLVKNDLRFDQRLRDENLFLVLQPSDIGNVTDTVYGPGGD
jgi:hypothetical protein